MNWDDDDDESDFANKHDPQQDQLKHAILPLNLQPECAGSYMVMSGILCELRFVLFGWEDLFDQCFAGFSLGFC